MMHLAFHLHLGAVSIFEEIAERVEKGIKRVRKELIIANRLKNLSCPFGSLIKIIIS